MTGPAVSGFQLQNLDEANWLTAHLDFRSADGQPATPLINKPPIAPLAAHNVYMPAQSALSLPVYGVGARGDRPMAAIARTEWPKTGGAALVSDAMPAERVIVPLLACRYGGQSSQVTVQNTDLNTEAVVALTAIEFGRSSPLLSLSRPVPAGGFIVFDACAPEFDGTLTGKGGYALLDASVPIVVQVLVNLETSDKAVYGFSGVPLDQAADTLYAPLFRNEFFGTTGIAVVSPTERSEVTVEFFGSLGHCAGQTYRQGPVTIAPASSAVFYQANVPVPGSGMSPLPRYCAGSAIVRATGGKVVAIVNDASGNPAAPTVSAAYNAISRSQAGRKIALPLYRRQHTREQLSTGIQAMNVGDAVARVEISFRTDGGQVIAGTSCGWDCRATLMPGASANWYPPMMSALPDGQFGSALITSDQPLAVIVTDASATGAIDSATYNGIKVDVGEPAP
jgi:hypothetical protein